MGGGGPFPDPEALKDGIPKLRKAKTRVRDAEKRSKKEAQAHSIAHASAPPLKDPHLKFII